MPDQPSALQELLGQVEGLQEQLRERLDDSNGQQTALDVNQLLATSNRLLTLSRVFLDMALKASNSAQRVLRQSEKR